MRHAGRTKAAAATVARPKAFACGTIGHVWIVGVGGTGAILADHVARMIAGLHLDVTLTLQDGDAVLTENLARQAFLPWELGANKAAAVALRLAGQLGLPIAHIAEPLTTEFDAPNDARWLLVTCTDNLGSRRSAAEVCVEGKCLWLDVGNAEYTGQAILGTTHAAGELAGVHAKWDTLAYATHLPDVAAVNPKVLTARGVQQVRTSCAMAPFAEQGPSVNAMAALAAAAIAKQILVDRLVKTPQIWFDVAAGRMLPRQITRDLFAPWAAAGKQMKKGVRR